MKRLTIGDGQIVYEYDEDATFEKDGKTYSFVSFKKITTFKGKQGESKKYQNLTVARRDLEIFKAFLRDILEDRGREPGEDSPF